MEQTKFKKHAVSGVAYSGAPSYAYTDENGVSKNRIFDLNGFMGKADRTVFMKEDHWSFFEGVTGVVEDVEVDKEKGGLVFSGHLIESGDKLSTLGELSSIPVSISALQDGSLVYRFLDKAKVVNGHQMQAGDLVWEKWKLDHIALTDDPADQKARLHFNGEN